MVTKTDNYCYLSVVEESPGIIGHMRCGVYYRYICS